VEEPYCSAVLDLSDAVEEGFADLVVHEGFGLAEQRTGEEMECYIQAAQAEEDVGGWGEGGPVARDSIEVAVVGPAVVPGCTLVGFRMAQVSAE
jgi:hypothetical protein